MPEFNQAKPVSGSDVKSIGNLKAWIAAFRLKTLPLALSNTIMGSALAAGYDKFRWLVFILAAFTTILLQILSNMANDYGDFVNGKDTAERIGPKRMVQSGQISARKMLTGIIVIGLITLICGGSLIIIGTQGIDISNLLIFGALGIAAIVAAIKYTVGKNPYGYRGYGDIFVFIFFGLIGVLGTYYLHSQEFNWTLLLPASAIGLLSTGVLNMNNLRDLEADKNANKRTIVVIMGRKKAIIYHYMLVVFAWLFVISFTVLQYESLWQWLFLITLPIFVLHLKKVSTYKESIELFPELGKLAISTLVFTLCFGIGFICK